MQSYVVSVHDVMPQSLDNCCEIIKLLAENGFKSPTLLVVPGLNWCNEELEQLRQMQRNGAILAGHGWIHRVSSITHPYHRLHSMLVSRDAAEHLALDSEEILQMIQRCHQFFSEHDLPVSDLYVPPAWALGSVRRSELANMPFRFFETLTGVFDAQQQSFMRVPMIGFEADTAFRALSCRLWNRINMRLGAETTPIRMAIHPNDLSLRLAKDLVAIIQTGGIELDYSAFTQ